MKIFIVIFAFSLAFITCNSDKESSYSPFLITIQEHGVELSIDAKGELFQNGEKIGSFSGDKILDANSKVVLAVDASDNILDNSDAKLASLKDDGTMEFEDDFLGMVTWTEKGELLSDSKELLGIQMKPNNPELYKQASLLLFYGEYIRE